MSKKEVHSANLEDLNDSSNEHSNKLGDVTSIGDVGLPVRVEFSRIKAPIKDVLQYKVGEVLKLDRYDGEDVDVFVGEKLVAKGEITVMDDKFAVRITEFVAPERQI